ncbi:MAG: hypothetical protein U0931_11620 [Vulcanimicrobiota bacterium]
MKVTGSKLPQLSPLRQRPVPVRSTPPLDQVQLSQSAERPMATGWLARAGALVALAGSSLACLAGPSSPALLSGATPAEAARLSARYSKVDPAVMQLLQKDGVKISVVHPGEPFARFQVLQGRQLADYEAQLPQMQSVATAVHKATAPFARRPDLKRQALLDALPQNSPAVPFRIPSLAGLLHDRDGLHRLVELQNQPKGTTRMAELVGARTPAEIQEYARLVESINGPRLQEARQASLAQATPVQQAAWAKDPGQIPLDLKTYDLLVPDLAYVADGQGGSLRVSLEDAAVQAAWADSQGRTLRVSSIHGQYFPPSRHILVQSSQVSPPPGQAHAHTPLHELGHALEDSVARHDPGFYSRWHSQLYTAYQKAQQNGGVSDYALSNTAEYIAEGVGHYYEDPQLLRQKDPNLFRLTEELLSNAARLGNR